MNGTNKLESYIRLGWKGAMTLGVTTLSITTLSILTFIVVALNTECCYDECHYVKRCGATGKANANSGIQIDR
jgi:hypothetical protein